MEKAEKRPELAYLVSSFNINVPQYKVNIDEEKAKKFGLNIDDILRTLQSFFGSSYISSFNKFNKFYRVIVQSDKDFRNKPSDLLNVFFKNNKGEMIRANAVITLEKTYGPEMIKRFNLATTAVLNGEPAAGYSSGDVIKAMEEVADEVLPRGFAYDWSALYGEEKNSGGEIVWIFLMIVVFVYLLLSAQYESYIILWAVLLSVPTGLMGSAIALSMADLVNNVYAQVALIMLVGLLAKNAVLIVEYGLLKRAGGMDILEAANEGAKARFRPILMTSFTFILGVLPLALATGAGALSKISVGTSTMGGMIAGTIFGVFLIPVLFVVFRRLHEKISGNDSK